MKGNTLIGDHSEVILIVEDSLTQSEQLRAILEGTGYVVSSARNGQEAIDAIRSGARPTIVISDIVMPGMDGYELCKNIKDDPNFRSIPVILLTSLSDPMDVMRGLECGADNFIFKPYEEAYLLARLSYMLANWRLKSSEPTQLGLEINFSGQTYRITSDRLQILNLLLSTYEAAIEKNRALTTMTAELESKNVLLAQEISDRKRAEEEANEARKEAERCNVAKSKFISHMSHELRTPLNAILGFAQLIQMDSSDTKTLEGSRLILKGGQHLLGLINEILDIARIESGKLTVSMEPVSLESAIGEAVQITLPIAQRKDISIEVNHSTCNGKHVLADRQRLAQVLLNLLTNAAKYNRQAGQIFVRCTESGADFVLEIEDTGRGISEEDSERLFKPFERFGDQAEEGTGIGLALSHMLVELMGGTLGLKHTSPQGSCFTVRLRMAHAQHDPNFTDAFHLPSHRQSGGGMKVLYIEDNESNIVLMKRAFETIEDIRLDIQSTAAAGIKAAQETQPDLIFLDLHLPDAHGLSVLTSLKSDPRVADIPVIVLSADTSRDQVRRTLEAGAAGFLAKPIDLKELFAEIERVRTQRLAA